MIKLAIFDLDGTLVDTNTAVKKLRENDTTYKLLRKEGYDVDKEEVRKALKRTDKKVKSVKGVQRFQPGFFQLVLSKELDYDISDENAARIEEKIYSKILENLELISGAKEILEYLKEKEVKLFLLSNSRKKAMNGKLEKFDLRKYFDRVFSSEESGTVKSGYEPFKRILNEVDIPADEILMVGNSLGEDAIANEFGMITALLMDYIDCGGDGEEFVPDYELNSLLDLKEIIEEKND